ncbi:acyl-CoA N-acyltransferase [Xylaria telfairii]|nr:acyl-CoA N-acyltransferase [Xylaria telfairii]
MPTLTIRLLAPLGELHMVPYLAAFHAARIHHERVVTTFLLPLDIDRLIGDWAVMMEDVRAGRRLIVICLDESEPGSVAKGAELRGVVMLRMPQAETAVDEGHVEKLMMVNVSVGSRAATTYAKLDYVQYNRVPGCSITPSGRWVDNVFFFKAIGITP